MEKYKRVLNVSIMKQAVILGQKEEKKKKKKAGSDRDGMDGTMCVFSKEKKRKEKKRIFGV